METYKRTQLKQKVDVLSRNWMELDIGILENEVLDIIVGLIEQSLSLHNSVITQLGSSPDGLYRLDNKESIGIKITRSSIEDQSVDRVISRAYESGFFERLIVFGAAGFTDESVQVASRLEPVQVELIDFPRLKTWIDGSSEQVEPELTSVQLLVRDFSRQIAELVANDPSTLESLEWRDVERMLSEACSGLGFQVELTRPAKDGGRDLVLQCWIFGHSRKYFVEVKHWATRVGHSIVHDFLKVVIENQADKGLILATTGYTENAFEGLTQIERRRVKGADREKTIAICQLYTRAKSGLYIPSAELPDLLFDDTLPKRFDSTR